MIEAAVAGVVGAYDTAMVELEAIPHLAVVVPTLLGLVIASRRSLRNWHAIQSAPIDEPAARRSVARRLVGAVVALTLVGAAEYVVLATAYATELLRGVAISMQFSALFIFTSYITGAFQLKVHRPAGGVPRLIPIREPKLGRKMLGVALPAAIMTYAAVELPAYHPASMFGSLALLVNLSSSHAPAPKITLRAMTIGVVCGEVLLLTLSAILACIAITAEVPLSDSPTEGDQGNFASIPKILVDSGFSRVILATWALWPALLISVARRFDYAQHIARGGQPLAAVETLDTGAVLVPRRQRQCGFRRPYARAVLVSMAATMYAVAQHGESIGITAKDDLSFMLVVLLIGQPIASFMVWAVAIVRGEMDAAWSYKEIWMAPADDGAIALPTEDAAPPAYGAADEKIDA